LEPADLRPRLSLDDCTHLFAPLPNTLQRRDLAQALYIAALDYVVLHELAHIARQHDRYCEGLSGLYFGETPRDGDRAPSKRPSLLRKLEADADLTAAYFSSHSHCRSRSLQVWRGWAESPAEALELWLFAISMTISLFGGWSDGPRRRTRYPHPSVRLALVMAQASWSVAKENDIDEAHIQKTLRETFLRALMAWARLGLPSDIAMSRGRPFMEWDVWSAKATKLHKEIMKMMYPTDESHSN
jgi:hypothetical protein